MGAFRNAAYYKAIGETQIRNAKLRMARDQLNQDKEALDIKKQALNIKKKEYEASGRMNASAMALFQSLSSQQKANEDIVKFKGGELNNNIKSTQNMLDQFDMTLKLGDFLTLKRKAQDIPKGLTKSTIASIEKEAKGKPGMKSVNLVMSRLKEIKEAKDKGTLPPGLDKDEVFDYFEATDDDVANASSGNVFKDLWGKISSRKKQGEGKDTDEHGFSLGEKRGGAEYIGNNQWRRPRGYKAENYSPNLSR